MEHKNLLTELQSKGQCIFRPMEEAKSNQHQQASSVHFYDGLFLLKLVISFRVSFLLLDIDTNHFIETIIYAKQTSKISPLTPRVSTKEVFLLIRYTTIQTSAQNQTYGREET